MRKRKIPKEFHDFFGGLLIGIPFGMMMLLAIQSL